MVNQKIEITTSRINVTEYNPNSSIEFLATAKKLRQSIENNGITFKAMAKSSTIGEGKMMFPDKFLEGIKEGMGDLEYEGSCSIEKNDEEVGKVIFKCRLIIKCEKEDRDESECRRNMDINQTDIMFVMAAPQECPQPHPCDTCKDAMQPEEGDERLQLDLDRYEPIKQPVHASPEENGDMDASCELKHMTKQFGHVIDSLVTQMNKLNPPTECLFTDWSGKPSNIKSNEVDRPMPVPLEDWQENGISPIRYCPVCLTPMSWLPKYSPCPKCSNKPKPEKKEEKKNKPTAEQIIQEYVKVPPTGKDACQEPCDVDIENPEKAIEDQNRCGCICKAGKMCLHCRMRLISADIFEKKMSDSEECPEVKPTSKEDFCVVVEKKEEKCCTQLENVFAELLELYNKKDAAEEAAQMGSQMSSSKKLSSLTSKRESGGQTTGASPASNAEKKRVKKRNNVPRRHGWDWKCTDEARKHGWKPGAISRYVFNIMKFFTQCSDDPNATNISKEVDEQEKQKQSNKPFLNICKQNGAICITFQSSDPSENPIMFKIVKSDEALILSELKRKLKAKGFPKCSCHKPLMLCVCREIKEKQQLAAELESECQLLGMESCVEELILTDTSESEMEYNLDVSPPEAPAQSTRQPIKRKSLNNSTQTENADDLEVKSKYPTEFNPYYRTYDCAVGDRYTGTAFGALGEEVFEDGVFGNQGGGAHGPLADPGGKSRPQTIWGSKPGEAIRGRDGAGGGTRRGPGGAVGGGFGGGAGGKSIPGAKKEPTGKSAPIPVRMPARYYKAEAEAVEKEKKAAEAAIAEKKKGINIIEYLEKKGTVSKPWNPNEPKEDKNKKTATELVVGKDGLTDAQRTRRALLQAPIPPLDTLPRLGKGYPQCDLCSCYPNPYSYQCNYCCDPCYYCC
ncbi:uncharacterized protein LOC132786303 [Drosophila nasuta]|uniref:uncharacterized protein LOC132786303 n=1 Tax=Drosophila nasuta TaxID=42062 RepID=UPI00295E312F|nr:uncharacterized protein LOC132786303 [Drosophila nasuta]